jgi:RNA-binding protein
MAPRKKTTINPRQKRFLRGLGHHLQVKAMIGKEGLTSQVVKAINEVVDADELVKVKVQENFPYDRKEAGPMLAAETNTALVQVIGRTILIYRGNPDLPKEQRLDLPR